MLVSAMRKVTIKDIARELNVSATTVSNALNDKPGVGKAARQKILTLAKEMGYQPDYFAKGLVSGQSWAIGLVISNIADPFYPELALGVQEKASEHGYATMLFNTSHGIENEKKIIEILKSRGVDGFLLATVYKDDPNIDLLERLDIPFVLVNRVLVDPIRSAGIDTVTLDNYGGSHKAATHLARLGHRKIAIITGDMNSSTAIVRTLGAKEALAGYGIEVPDRWLVEGGYSKDNAFLGVQKMLRAQDRPTAILAQDDNMALGVREAAFDAGLRIPEDLALVGFNDIYISSLTGIELTTVSHNQYDMGRYGAEMLIRKLKQEGQPGVCSRIEMEAELVVRKSCGFHLTGYTRDPA